MADVSEKERMTRIVQLLRSGQITIPAEFRRRLGITDKTMLRLTLEGQELRITPIAVHETVGSSAWFRELYEYFAPVRREAEQYSEEEINTTIDQAVAAARTNHARRS